MKRLYTLLIAIAATAGIVCAQRMTGSWQVVPMSSPLFTKVTDTPSKVFYLTGSSLYSYDKKADETTYYAPGQTLSSHGLSNMYYNPRRKYMVLVYTDSNIDIVHEDGRVVNVPDIREANLLTTKEVRHVSFADGRVYVATDFGFVVFDDKDFHVIESGIYDKAFTKVIEAGGYILALCGGELYASPAKERHRDFSSFEKWTTPAKFTDMIAPAGAGADFVYLTTNNVNKGTVNPAAKAIDGTGLRSVPGIAELVHVDGGVGGKGSAGWVKIGTDFGVDFTDLPADIRGQVLGSWSGAKSIWAGNRNGIGCYDVSGGSAVTVSDKYMPESSQVAGAAMFRPSADGKSVYLSGVRYARAPIGGMSYTGAFVGATHQLMERLDWESGTFTRVNPWLSDGRSGFISGTGMAVDDNDPPTIYFADLDHGLDVAVDGKLLITFNSSTAPFIAGWPWVLGVSTDGAGGVYALSRHNGYIPAIHHLPADKVAAMRRNPKSVTKDDWNTRMFDRSFGDCYRYFYIRTPKTPTLALFTGDYTDMKAIIDTKGTPDPTDDVHTTLYAFITQDGNTIGNIIPTCYEVDSEGRIWLGTSEGIFVVDDLSKAAVDGKLYVTRPKVARNDGTVYADYLLSTDVINGIATDPLNRKWVSTEASGLFLVSADGTEILENFTNTNSPLPTNQVWGVYCNPQGNEVYVNTAAGAFIYNSNAAPAADDYSEVYAFPNPVRPDYEGWITIQGLMDNSLVKIADSQGNVVAQGRSEGGMYVWDGCNAAGERVRSGVYMVLASQNSDGSSSGAVTKIVVIN
ncbi:MAG: hypothetical protein NC406_02090 [Bacteroides sp.]|nr:hypothetical protein [Bacteroides sp.]MCM1094963.1 hypothetical protein [Terasakiella sp.]